MHRNVWWCLKKPKSYLFARKTPCNPFTMWRNVKLTVLAYMLFHNPSSTSRKVLAPCARALQYVIRVTSVTSFHLMPERKIQKKDQCRYHRRLQEYSFISISVTKASADNLGTCRLTSADNLGVYTAGDIGTGKAVDIDDFNKRR